MYDPPGTHGYNGGLTHREARRADAAIKKRDQDKRDIKEGKVNENTSTAYIPAKKKGTTRKSFIESVFSFGDNPNSIVPVGGTRRRRKNRKKSSAKLRKKARSYRKRKQFLLYVIITCILCIIFPNNRNRTDDRSIYVHVHMGNYYSRVLYQLSHVRQCFFCRLQGNWALILRDLGLTGNRTQAGGFKVRSHNH